MNNGAWHEGFFQGGSTAEASTPPWLMGTRQGNVRYSRGPRDARAWQICQVGAQRAAPCPDTFRPLLSSTTNFSGVHFLRLVRAETVTIGTAVEVTQEDLTPVWNHT